MCGVVDLSVRFRHIAVLPEVLRQGHHIRGGDPQIRVETGHSDRVRQLASHQAGSRRMADRLLTIGPVKDDPLRRQSVEVRRDHIRLPIAIQIITQVIRCNEKDIGMFTRA